MLHTLQNQNISKQYTFKTSNLHHCVLRVTLHLVDLPLHQQTIIYIRKLWLPKLLLSPSDGLTREYMNFLLRFLYQSIPFITRQVCELLLLPNCKNFQVKLQNRHRHMQILCLVWTTPLACFNYYAELPSNGRKRETKQLRSRETVFYIVSIICYRR